MAIESVPVPLVVYQVKNKAFVVAGTGQATPDEMYSYADFEELVSHLAAHFGVKRVKQGMAQAVRDESDAHLG